MSVGALDDQEEVSRGPGLEESGALGLGEKSGAQVPQTGNGWGGRRRVSREDSPGLEWRVQGSSPPLQLLGTVSSGVWSSASLCDVTHWKEGKLMDRAGCRVRRASESLL